MKIAQAIFSTCYILFLGTQLVISWCVMSKFTEGQGNLLKQMWDK